MKQILLKLLGFTLLGFYLMIPFKGHFVKSLHFLSHFAQQQNHTHHHGPGINDHSHSLIEVFNAAIAEQQKSQQQPLNLNSFKFQVPFPSKLIKIPVEKEWMINCVVQTLNFRLPGKIFYEVPLPPP